MRLGTLVRVLKPDYAEGLLGTIEGYEQEFDRWIVKLEQNPLEDEDEPVRLSLAESEFEVIEPQSHF
ncbi:hypothetical protein [Myxosarcina sp. GI1(2024)]